MKVDLILNDKALAYDVPLADVLRILERLEAKFGTIEFSSQSYEGAGLPNHGVVYAQVKGV